MRMFNKEYKHAKVRKDSNFIYIEKCVDKRRIRFSTGYSVSLENMNFVESNYKILLNRYLLNEKGKGCVSNKYSVASYGLIVLELEKANLKDSTFLRYNNIFHKYIVPNMQDIPLNSITPRFIREIFATRFNGLSYANKGVLIAVLKKIFDYAIDNEIYERANPINCIKNKKKDVFVNNRNKPMEFSESLKILSYLEKYVDLDSKIKLYMQIALLTGMRVNEILALKYSDIDLQHRLIRIDKTLSKGKITTTKSGNIRNIDIIQKLYTLLEKYLNTNAYSPNSFIFYKDSKFISLYSITKIYKKMLEILNIENRTLYSTRHTFASVMLLNGEDILWVANMLGHKDISVTCKYYARYIKSDKVRGECFNTTLPDISVDKSFKEIA